MPDRYIQDLDGALRIADTRVSLDSVVYSFREGLSPESIVEDFPALNLEQVCGAIAYYLRNQSEVDQYLLEGERIAEAGRLEFRRNNPELVAKLRRARDARPVSR